jgi:antitoxin MazE
VSKHIETAYIFVYTCLNSTQRTQAMENSVKVQQTVQEWGNGLGVRITAPVAKAAHFVRGLPITVEVVDGGILLRPSGKPKLTLAQKLKLFDPGTHGGEVMITTAIGEEAL